MITYQEFELLSNELEQCYDLEYNMISNSGSISPDYYKESYAKLDQHRVKMLGILSKIEEGFTLSNDVGFGDD